ncbi:hypothetical protein HQ535_03180 [bacterium]|nr:hypothetical protein [bacterium]
MTSYVPQVQWYSGCRAGVYDLEEVGFPRRIMAESEVVWMIRVPAGKRQPDDDLWQRYLAETGGLVFETEGSRPVEVYSVTGG